jgi:hypothetical protein
MRAWHVLLGAVLVLLLLVLQFKPIDDVDVFWQIRLGQLMLHQGDLIRQDVFSFTHFGEPVPAVGWLAQVLFALAFEVSGWRAVLALQAMLYALGFAVVGVVAVRYVGAGRLSLMSLGTALALGLIAASSNVAVRPQSFALVCFALVLSTVLRSELRRESLLILAAVAVAWQNLHPSLGVGVVATASLAAAAWWQKLLNRGSASPWPVTIATAVLGAAQMATPDGLEVLAISRANVAIARNLLEISEWMPPWDVSVRGAMLGFYVAAAGSVAMLLALRCRIPFAEFALFITMTALSLFAARFVIFWSLAMIPIWARWVESLRGRNRFEWPADAPLFNRSLFPAAALLGAVALIVPPMVQGPPGQRYPLQPCLRALYEAMPAGRIYNYREWGGPLILAGHPSWRVAIDGRLYHYSREDWLDYYRVAMGLLPTDLLMSKYHPSAFLLHPGFHQALIESFERSEAVTLIYRNEYCYVYVTRDP